MSANEPILPAQPPSHGEQVPPGETEAMAAIIAAIERQVTTQANTDGTARRDAHAKAHGTVQAEFRVLEDLPASLQAGIFAAPRRFPALIRFSNGSGKIQADLVPDGRGMAVKLLNVEQSPSSTQDFVMINHSAFFVRDAADYVEFSTAAPQTKFFVNLEHPRLHEAAVAAAIALHLPDNPLNSQYWSMTPYCFGDQACKFSARPAGMGSSHTSRLGHDYLHDNLARHLAEAGAEFDFMVQLRTRPDKMPIEDPTITWSDDDSPFVPVARITIPPQNFDSPDQRAFGEALSFTPWHAIAEHRPLGGINRVRRAVYEAISLYRHQFNRTARVEPTSLPPLGPAVPISAERS